VLLTAFQDGSAGRSNSVAQYPDIARRCGWRIFRRRLANHLPMTSGVGQLLVRVDPRGRLGFDRLGQ
jgi:hypothetical protein